MTHLARLSDDHAEDLGVYGEPASMASRAGGLRAAWVDVRLDAIEHNFQFIARRVAPSSILGVVKADAYGHGAPRVARLLEALGAAGVGVALVEEGVELRRHGVESPVLVFGPARDDQFALFARHRFEPVVSALDQLQAWSRWVAAKGGAIPVHLEFDTGMTRLGIDPADARHALDVVRASPGLALSGIASHLSDADRVADGSVHEQSRRLTQVLEHLSEFERATVRVHCANSAGALHHAGVRHSMVRPGLALYGYDTTGTEDSLRPALELRALVNLVRRVEPGARVGYGGRFVAEGPTLLAVVPVGYADGYTGRGDGPRRALLRGRSVPVVGAISMDMLVLDASATGAEVGDEVTLLGEQGEASVGLRELAPVTNAGLYEALCLFGLRLPRRYWNAKHLESIESRFLRGGLSL